MSKALPDGAAHGKIKIFQVNTIDQRTGEEEPPTIFEYYTEYGTDGVVHIRCDGNEFWASVEALVSFTDFFRKELEAAK